MKTALTLLLGTLAVATAQRPAVLPKTQSFRLHLQQLHTESRTLTQCLTKVTHPLSEASNFAKHVQSIHDIIQKIQGRISSTEKIIKSVMALPYIGALATPVLSSVSTVLQSINNGLKTVTGHIDHVVGVIRSWLSPLKAIQEEVKSLNGMFNEVIHVIGKVEIETQKMVNCLNHLPEGLPKQHGAAALEKIAGSLDHVPKGLLSPVNRVTGACNQLEHFMSKLHLVRRKRGLPSLSKVTSTLEKIDNAFGPLGKFLDKIQNALNQKICLVGSLLEIGKKVVSTVLKTGEAVVSGAVSAGKSVIHSISHHHHHLFGRRGSDDRYYVIVDSDVDTRKRGLDLCFTIANALKVVNGVTGGMISEAQKYIGEFFHGKLAFTMPGLTSDVLNLGNVLKIFNFQVPNVESLLKIGLAQFFEAVHLDLVKGYIAAVPQCKAALTIG